VGQTIVEKILAYHSELDTVVPGQIVNAKIDLIMCHDVTTTPAIDILEKYGIKKVFDPDKIVIMPDHFVPNKDIKSAEMVKRIRTWAKEQGISKFYEVGRHGICHALLPEEGYVKPGITIICGDSHTTTHGAFGAFATGIGSTDLAAALATGELWFKVPETILIEVTGKLPECVYAKDIVLKIISILGVDGATYKAIEFTGNIIEEMSMEGRMTICNMAIESGGKAGIIKADNKTKEYLDKKGVRGGYTIFESDEDANYCSVIKIDVSDMEPVVAFPHLPSNVKGVSEIRDDIVIDQAFIGSCTNGRIEDLRVAAKILKGRKVAEGVRMIVIPATTEVWKQADREGLLYTFMEAGAAVSTPTCGPCLGGHMGVLASSERCISSTNRNFVGRMGSPESEVFLASPATVAASAIEGKITDPRKYL